MNRYSLQDIVDGSTYTNLKDIIDDWMTTADLPAVIDVDVTSPLDSGTGTIGGNESDELTFVATGQGVIHVGSTDDVVFEGPVTGPPVALFTFASVAGKVKVSHAESLFLEWFGGGSDQTATNNATAFNRATYCSSQGGGIPVQLLSGIYAHNGLQLYTGSAVLGEGTELRANDQTTQLLSTTNQTGIPETVFLQDLTLTGESSSTSQEIEFANLDRLILDKVQVRKAETTGSVASTLIIDSCDNVQITACRFDAPCQFDTEGTNTQISQSKFASGGTENDLVQVDGNFHAFNVTNCIFADAPGSAIRVKNKMNQMVISGNVITQKVVSNNSDPVYAAIAMQADQSTSDDINHIVLTGNQITTDFAAIPAEQDDPGAVYLSGKVQSMVIAGNMIHTTGAGGAIRCKLASTPTEQLQFVFVTGNNLTSDTLIQDPKAAFWIEGTGTSDPIIRIILQGNSLGGYADPPSPTADATEILRVDSVATAQRAGIQIVPNSNTLNGQLDGNIYADQTGGSVSGMRQALPRNRYVAYALRDDAQDPENYYGGLAFADSDSTHDLSFRFGSTTDPADVEDNFAGLVTTHRAGTPVYDNVVGLHASGEGSDQPVVQCYLLKVQNGSTVEVRRIAEVVKAGWDTGALVLEDRYVYLDQYSGDNKKHLRIASSAPTASGDGDLVPFQGVAVADAIDTGTDQEIRDSVVKQFNDLLDSLRDSGGLKE